MSNKLAKTNKELKILIYADVYDGYVAQKIEYLTLMDPYGACQLVYPKTDYTQLINDADVLLLPGGADINPLRYGERPHLKTSRLNPFFESLDNDLLKEWINTGKPIIGICRGMQTLNVALGGSLFQHVDYHIGNHKDRAAFFHNVYTDIFDREKDVDFRIHPTNSFHHQAVKDLGDELEVWGWSHVKTGCVTLLKHNKEKLSTFYKHEKKEDGTIILNPTPFFGLPEIIKHRTLPYIGFQYHPEEFNCRLFHYLVNEMLTEWIEQQAAAPEFAQAD